MLKVCTSLSQWQVGKEVTSNIRHYFCISANWFSNRRLFPLKHDCFSRYHGAAQFAVRALAAVLLKLKGCHFWGLLLDLVPAIKAPTKATLIMQISRTSALMHQLSLHDLLRCLMIQCLEEFQKELPSGVTSVSFFQRSPVMRGAWFKRRRLQAWALSIVETVSQRIDFTRLCPTSHTGRSHWHGWCFLSNKTAESCEVTQTVQQEESQEWKDGVWGLFFLLTCSNFPRVSDINQPSFLLPHLCGSVKAVEYLVPVLALCFPCKGTDKLLKATPHLSDRLLPRLDSTDGTLNVVWSVRSKVNSDFVRVAPISSVFSQMTQTDSQDVHR